MATSATTHIGYQAPHNGNSTGPVTGKKIAFILYNYPLAVSTMLINSIRLLAEHNEVTVLISEAAHRDQPCDTWLESHLLVYPDFRGQLVPRLLRSLVNRLCRLFPCPRSLRVWKVANLDVIRFSRWLKQLAANRGFDILMPVECYSLIAVHRLGDTGADIIYYNMELLDRAPSHPLHRNVTALKELEDQALESVSHVMITSPERARIFCGINRFPRERVSALPVLPLGRAIVRRTDWFRRKFGIRDDRIVVVYSGNFQPWAQCVEIIESMSTWPENAVLVMHTWSAQAANSDYYREMTRSARGRPVYFSTDYLLYDDLSIALASADIGLLFYQAIDSNFTEILFSSNKMAEYMAAGLPVLCSPFPSLTRFVLDEGIGLSCEFGDLGQSISAIASDLDAYRGRVARCRQQHFRFEPHFESAFKMYAANRRLLGTRGTVPLTEGHESCQHPTSTR